jgi:hypothetical protein
MNNIDWKRLAKDASMALNRDVRPYYIKKVINGDIKSPVITEFLNTIRLKDYYMPDPKSVQEFLARNGIIVSKYYVASVLRGKKCSRKIKKLLHENGII